MPGVGEAEQLRSQGIVSIVDVKIIRLERERESWKTRTTSDARRYFDIEMNNVSGMQMLKCLDEIANDQRHIPFGVLTTIQHVLQEISPVNTEEKNVEEALLQ